jgi:ankyrin repeat protein
MWRRGGAVVEPIRKAVSLSVKAGCDAAATRDAWDQELRFLTTAGQLTITVNRDHGEPEVRLDWNALPSEIAHYTALLQKQPEYGGATAYLDVYEQDRKTASQDQLARLLQERRGVQADAESDARVALLQPRVSSLEGIFQAAELGHVEVLKSMIRGYPLPTYDSTTGTFHPNLDRCAIPQQKHVLRETKQLSHTTSALQYATSGSYAAGDAMDDLRQAAPHLFDAAGKLASSYELRDAHGGTLLHVAAAAGQHLVIELLLEEGCDPNAQDRTGQTPLHLACRGGYQDAVRALMKGGARRDLVAADGRSIMHCVAVGAHKDLCDWMLLGKEMKAHEFHLELEKRTTVSRESVLHVLGQSDASNKAKQRNALEVGKIMLKAWSFLCNRKTAELLEMADSNGRTALHTCAASNSTEFMRYLCSCGLSPNIQATSGDVALHISVRLASVAACNFIISAGTDLSIENSDGDTPLHVAAAVGNFEVFKMCMQASPAGLVPPVIARFNKAGDSPLHVAARLCDRENELGDKPYHEMLQFACLNRADPMHANAHGLTPAMAAALGGNPKTVSFLVRYTTGDDGTSAALTSTNNDGENIFLFAARAGVCAVLAELAELPGVDLHCVSHTKVGAVAMASHAGHTDAVRLLVSLGCDPMHRDMLGRTALHWAAKAGHAAVCEVLVEEGEVPPDVLDRGGATPLHQAWH